MMKLSRLYILSSFLLFGLTPVKADYDRYGIEMGDSAQMYYDGTAYYNSAVTNIYKYNSETGNRILLNTNQHCPTYQSRADWLAGAAFRSNDRCSGFNTSDYTEYDSKNGKIFVRNNSGKQWSYDIESNTWSFEDAEDYTISHAIPLIRQSENGITSIGQNSLNFQETSKKLNLWGTNLDGQRVPVNVTSGLLINGRDVEQSINNVGALSAALTGLPTLPKDTTLACGLGTGTHGGDFAFSGGCSSRINQKFSVNYAASMTIPGQEFAGDFEDQFSARAGFVWQLGKSNKPTQISTSQKKELDLKISKLEKDNEELKIKNNKIISQNEKLLARLEKIENIAFKLHKEDKYELSKSITE